MQLIESQQHICDLVRISKEAFDSDLSAAVQIGALTEYDLINWRFDAMGEGHLLTALDNGKVVGGASVFRDDNNSSHMYVGRIFVRPSEFGKGYEIFIMKQLENMYADVSVWESDIPIWNLRMHRIYKEAGYTEKRRDGKCIYYQKNR